MDKFLSKKNVAKAIDVKDKDDEEPIEIDLIETKTDEAKKDAENKTNLVDKTKLDATSKADKKDPETMVLSSDSEEVPKEPVTPVTVRTKNDSLSSSKKRLTASETQQLRLENAKKKEEAKEQRLKLEEERKKRKAEEEERKQQRLKREEENRKKRAEEEERKAENRRKMEELRRIREEEKIKREEERIKQMEEKIKREEEKDKQNQERLEKERLKNETKLKEDEEKRRKADLVKNQFAKFFIKIDTPKPNDKEEQKMYRFMSFQLKENMSLAPNTRRDDIKDQKEFVKNLDEILAQSKDASEEKPSNYLTEIRQNPDLVRRQKTNCRKSKQPKKTIEDNPNPVIDEESVMSIEEIKCMESQPNQTNQVQNQFKIRVKYLHFDMKVYRRPPYYGTWRKKSMKINPKNPFAMDEKLIDYEVDSDDEWEDIADGESIADSDKGDSDKEDGDDEDDDGFLVPHGHLSDDELDEDERMMDPETKKAREAAKGEQWETERKKTSKYQIAKCFFKTEYWNTPEVESESLHLNKHLKLLERSKMVPFLKDFSVSLFPINITSDQQAKSEQMKQQNEEAIKKTKISNLDVGNASSPTTTPKTKLKKKNNDGINSNNSPSIVNATNATPNTNAPSILKFVSKMSNKNVVCKAENANTNKSESKGDSPVKVIGSKPPLPSNKVENSPLNSKNLITKNTTNSLNTPKSTNKLSSAKSTSLLTSTLTTPSNSPKLNTANNTTAEKRANSSNGENSVKRMKLDEIEPKSGEKSQNTPSIATLFRNNSCRKNLKLNNGNSEDSPKPISIIKKNMTSHRNSIDGVIDAVIRESDNQMETDSVVTNDKENSCITLD